MTILDDKLTELSSRTKTDYQTTKRMSLRAVIRRRATVDRASSKFKNNLRNDSSQVVSSDSCLVYKISMQ